MTGFREQLFDQAVAILEHHLRNNARITVEQGQALRQAWECAKAGNVLLDAVVHVVGYQDPDMIGELLRARGFFVRARELVRAASAKQDTARMARRGPGRGRAGRVWVELDD